MLRTLRKLLIPAAIVVAVWRFGGVEKVVGWLRSGSDAMTGKTAVHVAQDARRDLLRSNLKHALDNYRSTFDGQDPPDLESLVQSGFLWQSDLRDEWGRPLEFEKHAGRLVVRGVGADGKRGTDDDWVLGD